MDGLRHSLPGLLRLVVLALALALPGWATAQQAAPEVELPAASDVRIIVDISGSMKQTDPENLRQPAVRLLARLLPEGSTAGVWTFGQYVNMLVPHREVNDAWRELAVQRSDQINSVALRTNLGAAIETASNDYYTDGDLSRTHFILLTDGKVDISDEPGANAAEEERILDTVAADLIERGATFHPVALSKAADTDFLKALASRSGGRFQVAENADALNLAFLEALNTAVPQAQIPIEGNAFTVDSGVEEFTALIFWGESETSATRELALVRPDGEILTLEAFPDNVRWAREAGYDLVTVTDPQAGQWRLNGKLGEGSRVTVVSDLRMVVSPLSASFSAENPLDIAIAFFEDQEKITNPDFLGVLEVSLSITSEDGRSGTKVLSGEQPPADGTYRDTVNQLPAPGLYRFDVVADGQTFSRKFTATVSYTVPEGAQAEPAPPSETGETPVQEPTPAVEGSTGEPTPGPEPASAEPAIAPPIDISQVEAPAATASPEPESQATAPESAGSGMPLWAIGAGSGGLLAVAGLVWFAVRQRGNRQAQQEQAAAGRETLPDLEDDAGEEPEDNLPLEPESEPEPEPEPESEPEPELETEPEPDPEPELEDIPEVTEPVMDNEPDTVADEDIPELEQVAESPDTDPSEADDEEEFGLEDFDLSEFDDLPDYDEDQSGLPDDESDRKEPKK